MILLGDCRDVLKTLPDASIDCCVTSPPYFGLRNYGVDGQIGLEQTPEAYVAQIVAVFQDVRRVLKHDGTVWLNLGDSYAGSGKGGNPVDSPHRKQATNKGSISVVGNTAREAARTMGAGADRLYRGSQLPAGLHESARQGGAIGRAWVAPPDGYKQKDMIGIPWMVAFALRADGWYLRSDIIWSKPNPMPESVTDRPTKAHEYLFLLSKSKTYHYDAAAIAEPCSDAMIEQVEGAETRIVGNTRKRADQFGGTKYNGKNEATGDRRKEGFNQRWDEAEAVKHSDGSVYTGRFTRNRRSVWSIPTQPCADAHFAVMPEDLVEPCIRAGCRDGGTVLDPFAGAGTVGVVCEKLQRSFIGIELNPDYITVAERRINAVAPLFAAAQSDVRLAFPSAS